MRYSAPFKVSAGEAICKVCHGKTDKVFSHLTAPATWHWVTKKIGTKQNHENLISRLHTLNFSFFKHNRNCSNSSCCKGQMFHQQIFYRENDHKSCKLDIKEFGTIKTKPWKPNQHIAHFNFSFFVHDRNCSNSSCCNGQNVPSANLLSQFGNKTIWKVVQRKQNLDLRIIMLLLSLAHFG